MTRFSSCRITSVGAGWPVKRSKLQSRLADEHVDTRNHIALLLFRLFDQQRLFGIVDGVEYDHGAAQAFAVEGTVIHVRMHPDRRTVHDDLGLLIVTGTPFDGPTIQSFGQFLGPSERPRGNDDLDIPRPQGVGQGLRHAARPQDDGGLPRQHIDLAASPEHGVDALQGRLELRVEPRTVEPVDDDRVRGADVIDGSIRFA